jgi:hypothetical protein
MDGHGPHIATHESHMGEHGPCALEKNCVFSTSVCN